MDFIFDFLVYGIFEFLGEIFVSLFTAFIPSRKLSFKTYRILFITGLVVSLLLFAGLIYGIILLVGSNAQSFLGWVFITLAVVYIISGIVFKIINKKSSR